MIYKRLKGKIYENYGTQVAFANKIGVSESYLSKRLSGKTPMSLQDVKIIAGALGITDSMIGAYFFNR